MAGKLSKVQVLLPVLLLSVQVSAQNLWPPVDTLNRTRLYTSTAIGGGLAAGSLVGLYSSWYSNYPQSAFHGINDFDNWRGMDKLGHALTAYAVGENAHAVLRWSGVDEKRATWYGGLTGWGYLAAIEVMDGFSAGWGFSTADFAFNTLGSGMFIGQQLAWGEQRIRMKYSYHNTEFARHRPEVLGSGWTEKWLKDYNGQTYWLSLNPRSFSHSETGWWPRWLNVAAGYGATGMTGGDSNPDMNAAGETIPGYQRGSQYYLSLDIDLRKIPVKSAFWRGVFRVVNVIKIPAPTLEYRTTDEKLYFHPVYF